MTPTGDCRLPTDMIFILRMSLREFRASWRRLLFFFLCVADRRRRDRRAPVDHPEPAARPDQRSAHDDRLGRHRADQSCLDARGARQSRRDSGRRADPRRDRIDRDPDDGARRAGHAPWRAWWSCAPSRPAFPFYGTLALADGRAYSHDLLAGRGALVGPELLVQLGMSVGDRLMIGGQPFTIRGVIAQEPGRRIGAFSFGARVIVDLDDLRQAGLLGFGSRASYQRLLKVREDGVDRLTTAAAPGTARQLRVGPLLRVARGRHRRGPDPRRELSEPRRLRDCRARRHRRLERDPRLRAPEDQERGHPEVPWRDHRAGPRHLRRAGGAARPGRRPDGRAPRRAGHADDSRVARRRRSAA